MYMIPIEWSGWVASNYKFKIRQKIELNGKCEVDIVHCSIECYNSLYSVGNLNCFRDGQFENSRCLLRSLRNVILWELNQKVFLCCETISSSSSKSRSIDSITDYIKTNSFSVFRFSLQVFSHSLWIRPRGMCRFRHWSHSFPQYWKADGFNQLFNQTIRKQPAYLLKRSFLGNGYYVIGRLVSYLFMKRQQNYLRNNRL